jgi:hypothetical protein
MLRETEWPPKATPREKLFSFLSSNYFVELDNAANSNLNKHPNNPAFCNRMFQLVTAMKHGHSNWFSEPEVPQSPDAFVLSIVLSYFLCVATSR